MSFSGLFCVVCLVIDRNSSFYYKTRASQTDVTRLTSLMMYSVFHNYFKYESSACGAMTDIIWIKEFIIFITYNEDQ